MKAVSPRPGGPVRCFSAPDLVAGRDEKKLGKIVSGEKLILCPDLMAPDGIIERIETLRADKMASIQQFEILLDFPFQGTPPLPGACWILSREAGTAVEIVPIPEKDEEFPITVYDLPELCEFTRLPAYQLISVDEVRRVCSFKFPFQHLFGIDNRRSHIKSYVGRW